MTADELILLIAEPGINNIAVDRAKAVAETHGDPEIIAGS
jgi:hypothetical protein